MAKLRWPTHADLAIRKRCEVDREEYLDHMRFRTNSRPLFTEIFGPIVGLKEEWLDQGATPEELDFSAFRYRCERRAGVPVKTGCLAKQTTSVVEETDEYRVTRDGLGRTMKMMKGVSTLALPMDWPVRTMDDWLKVKHHYEFTEERFGKDWEAVARKRREEGAVVCVSIPGGFDEPRQLMGEANLCMAYYDDPELIHAMLETMRETACRVLDRVFSTVQVDLLAVHEDMAGKGGCLIGPNQIETFLKPFYRGVWDLAEAHGVQLFDLDTDGDINSVIPALLDAGVNCMHPMEPAANVDIVKVRERYGDRLAFYGGIDKHVLRRSKEEIRTELEYKIPPMLETGGCVLGVDHRIPNGTPLENYRYYVDTVWEMIEP